MAEDDKLLEAEIIDDGDNVVGERFKTIIFGVPARLPPTAEVDRDAAMIL